MKLRIKPDPKIKDFLWPKYKTDEAAAFDIYLQEDISLRPGEPAEISLGFSTEMDPGWAVEILPRSSTGMRCGVHVWNTLGLIDSDYHGIWCAKIDCRVPCRFRRGDRLLQALIRKVERAEDVEVEHAPRGDHSGSTGGNENIITK